MEQFRRSLAGETRRVSDEEIDQYLAEHPPAPGTDPARARERVAHYLGERERLAAEIAALEALRTAAGARVLLVPPARPRTEFDTRDLARRGPDAAPVEIVHFASLTSRHGRRSAGKLERLVAAYPDRILRVHVHLIGDRDETALHAARIAVLAAARSGEDFWRLHDALVARDDKLTPAEVERIAVGIGLERSLVERAARDPVALRGVKRDIDRAVGAGIPREPGLFVNGLFVSGLAPYEELRDLVEAELASASTPKGEGATPRR